MTISTATKKVCDSAFRQSIDVLSISYAECHIQALNAEFHYTECHYSDCHYAECHGAL